MDPTPLNPSKSNRHRNRHHHPHPLPDPTILPPSTIQNISHRFNKLYANHKKSRSKPPNGSRYIHQPPHPEPETDFQTKPPVLDTSCTTLTKSKSQHEGKPNSHNLSMVKVVKVKGADGIKKPSNQNDLKNPSNQKDLKNSSLNEFDVKKASQLMSKSLEVRREGVELRRPSVSSIPPMVNGGRRKSFCSSQADLADFFSGTGVKVVAVDMPPFMQIHAVDCARKTHDSLEKFTSKSLALTLKKEFDGVYGPAWHCIVGTSFGSFVTHSVGGFMYFSMDQKLYVLLFKTTVQRAAAE